MKQVYPNQSRSDIKTISDRTLTCSPLPSSLPSLTEVKQKPTDNPTKRQSITALLSVTRILFTGVSAVLREDCSRFDRKLIEVQHLRAERELRRMQPRIVFLSNSPDLLSFSHLGRSPLLSPSLGKFRLKWLTNLPCQGYWSCSTQRISINLHESWPLLDWFMSR